jgi:hypothetical protein
MAAFIPRRRRGSFRSSGTGRKSTRLPETSRTQRSCSYHGAATPSTLGEPLVVESPYSSSKTRKSTSPSTAWANSGSPVTFSRVTNHHRATLRQLRKPTHTIIRCVLTEPPPSSRGPNKCGVTPGGSRKSERGRGGKEQAHTEEQDLALPCAQSVAPRGKWEVGYPTHSSRQRQDRGQTGKDSVWHHRDLFALSAHWWSP